MNSHISTEQISLALDKRLSPQDLVSAQEHLTGCPTCRQEWDAWHVLGNRFAQAPLIGPAPGFVQRFEQRLHRHQANRRNLLGGVVLLTGSVSLWSLLALFGAIFGIAWVSAHPAWAGSVVQFAVRLAHTLQPLTIALRLFINGLLQIPTPVLSISVGSGLLILAIIWAQLINWQRGRLSALPG